MIILYHASPIKGITQLKPKISNHGIPLIYFSKKRENVLVYLSNAIEKYCLEKGFAHDGSYEKWGPYGFDEYGRFQLQEYYPDALKSTYQGVSGYIYGVCDEELSESGVDVHISDAVTSRNPVKVFDTEFVADAYEAILQAEKEGLISIMRYKEMSAEMRGWLVESIRNEYEGAIQHPEYQFFLRGNFPDILSDK